MTSASYNTTSNAHQMATAARYELLKHLRRRRLLAVVIISILVGLLLIVVPYALNVPKPLEAATWANTFFSFAATLIVIVGAFFAGDVIASEFEHKTGYILFPNPVKRSSLVLGKFAAALISGLLPIVIYYVLGVGSIAYSYGMVPVQVLYSFLYAVVYLCCVLGVTFLFSAVFRGTMAATLLSFFLFILIFAIISGVITLAGIEPWFLPNYSAGMITQVINPNPLPDSTEQIRGLTVYTFYPKYPTAIIVLIAYFVIGLALSVFIADKKEMT